METLPPLRLPPILAEKRNFSRRFRHRVFLPLVFLMLTLAGRPGAVSAQDLEPRRWSPLPVDLNFLGAAYAYTEADIFFNPVLQIVDAEMEMHTTAVKYLRTFELFGRLARAEVIQSYQEGKWDGQVGGVPTSISRGGFGDTMLRFAVNLYGAPPLDREAFRAWSAENPSQTHIGIALGLQLPTGEYLEDRLINLGTNRYTFRPQIGFERREGPWSYELTGVAAFFTDNDEFFNGNRIEQDPVYAVHAHLIYHFNPTLWAAGSFAYSYGGESTLNGTRQDDTGENLYWAFGVGYALSRDISFKVGYLGGQTEVATGQDSSTFSVGLSCNW